MKKLALVPALLLAVSSAMAAAPQMKAGLWEVHIIKQTVDGKDMSAQMAAAQAQMQQMLANMPPEQRKQMEQRMGAQAMPRNNTQRICISPEMAAQNKPVAPADARCEPSNIVNSGNKTTFELNCPTITGKGETIINGDTAHSKMEMVNSDARGRHTMQSETEMKYLGADCQGIKPADQIVRELQQRQRR